MKIVIKRKVLCLALICGINSSVFANVDQATVGVSPSQTNNFAEYTITSATGTSSLRAGQDSIRILFNTSTNVPNNITSSLITVNNTAVNAVDVEGQLIRILTPVNVAKGGPFTIVIDEAAHIKNPTTAATNYTIQVATNRGGDQTLVTSGPYAITSSTSTVSPAAVTPNPSVAGSAASYEIGFNVGSGGFLEATVSTVTIAFPLQTSIPDGSLSGVTLNGTPASATAISDTVIVTTPIDVENNGAVEIVFAIGSGIQNPNQAGTNYQISVKTSSESTFIFSDTYVISAAGQLSISAITSKPDTVNQVGEFAFDFRTGSSGALNADIDSIVVIFESNTYIPSDLAPSSILVSSGGFSDNASSVLVFNGEPADDDTVFVVTPINIGGSADVTLTFGSSSGYQNPSVAGNYSLKMRTSKDITVVSSNPYSLANTTTTVSQAIVTPANTGTGATTSYTVNFDLGSLGRLKADESTITLTFDNAYTISVDTNDYDLSQVVIGGTDIIDLAGSQIAPNSSARTIQITIPPTAFTSNSSNINLILDGSSTDPITNPNSPNNYILDVKTSVEATDVNSATYNIGGDAITINSVTLGNPTVNYTSSYTFNITTVNDLRNNQDDYIKIIFPAGTVLPASISGANVTADGRASASVGVNQETRTITAFIGTGAAIGGTFDVVVTAAANLTNPTVPNDAFYRVTMNTSKDEAPVNSAYYAITGNATQVSNVSASANPSVVSATNVAYTVYFTTSSYGKLRGGAAAGSSTITVDFDSTTLVPSSILASSVKINSVPSAGVTVLESDSGIVRITLPNGQTINNNTAATIDFASSAGLDNSVTPGTYNVSVRTSSDTTYSDTVGTAGDYSLGSSQDLSVTSVTLNPTTQNAAASYSIKFTTGSLGALSAGNDSIRIVFPSYTGLPATINLNDVTVNSQNPPSNPRISADTVIIAVPDTVTPLTEVTVLLSQSANILNPTVVSSYTLEVGTDAEPGLFTSPSYNITSTSTTVSVANVTVIPPTPSAGAAYTIDFSVGNNGKLIAGTSTITVTFNASTGVNTTPGNYDSTYIVVDGSSTKIPQATNISVSGQAVTFTVPGGVSVDNGDNVTLIINRTGTPKPLTNPTTAGDYTLDVRSSVETKDIESNAYTISSVTPVTNVTMSLSPDIVNATATDTISFTAQNTLTSGSGTVTMVFPYNTFIPASIPTSNVRLANITVDPSTYNPVDAVVVNTSTRTVTITVPTTINPGNSVRIAFPTAAGLQNPSIAGNYTVTVRTSSQPLNSVSSAYALQPTTTTILNFSISIDPITPGEFAEFQYSFTTGSQGRMVSGTSTINLIFPDDVAFTSGTPATSKVTVNSTAADALVLKQGAGTIPDTLVVTVPSSVTIGNSSVVTVIVDNTAGVRNATVTTPLTYEANTSIETGSIGSDFSLPVTLTSFKSESENGKVILTWVTESEIDNAYWIIERKELSKTEYENLSNGKLNLNDVQEPFINTAQIYGQGTTTIRTEYVYVDSLVTIGGFYAYRLANVSYHGQVIYHDVIFQEVAPPLNFNLEQNFPNPFNPNTHITFSLPTPSDVKLIVYNILGQEVKTLVSNIKDAGIHTVQWDARNQGNKRVSSGVYIYMLQARSLDGTQKYSKVRKMIVLK